MKIQGVFFSEESVQMSTHQKKKIRSFLKAGLAHEQEVVKHVEDFSLRLLETSIRLQESASHRFPTLTFEIDLRSVMGVYDEYTLHCKVLARPALSAAQEGEDSRHRLLREKLHDVIAKKTKTRKATHHHRNPPSLDEKYEAVVAQLPENVRPLIPKPDAVLENRAIFENALLKQIPTGSPLHAYIKDCLSSTPAPSLN